LIRFFHLYYIYYSIVFKFIIEIYLLKRKFDLNINETDEVSAINYIEKRIKELIEFYDYDEDYKLFKIVKVKEGEKFDAYIQM
jgi:hypothetical protein